MLAFLADSEIARVSKRILLCLLVCLFVCLFVTWVMWCSAEKVLVSRTYSFGRLSVFALIKFSVSISSYVFVLISFEELDKILCPPV